MNNKTKAADKSEIGGVLIKWYDKNQRSLPWRFTKKNNIANCNTLSNTDVYKIWLSEIMLQQTTVATVKNYYEKFLKLWPTVNDMASAHLHDILHEWAGLGYYARARNLHKCATIIANDYQGKFPHDMAGLLALPGIGPYTAAAISAIAFSHPAPAIDGNAERLFIRLYGIKQPVKKIKTRLKEIYMQHFINDFPSAYVQAVMDIAATICTPTAPKCHDCPLTKYCTAFDNNMVDILPIKTRKKQKPTRNAALIFVQNHKSDILISRRNEKSLLGGMLEFVGSNWDNKLAEKSPHQWQNDLENLCAILSVSQKNLHPLSEKITHEFTHFKLQGHLYHLRLNERQQTLFLKHFNQAHLVKKADFPALSFPTFMAKAKNIFMANIFE